MKATLRTARKIETQIGQYLEENPLLPTVKTRVSSDKTAATAVLQQANLDFKAKIKEQDELLVARYAIRESISKANSASGIDDLLNQKVVKEKQLQRINALVKVDVQMSAEELEDTLTVGKAKLTSGAPTHYGESLSVTTHLPVLTAEDQEELKKQKASLKKEIDKIEESLNKLNYNTEIEISAPVETLLKKHNIL